MVLQYLRGLLSDRFGCDEEEITLAATLDQLNLSADDVYDIIIYLQDVYGVEFFADAEESLETIEDIVGYVEDQL